MAISRCTFGECRIDSLADGVYNGCRAERPAPIISREKTGGIGGFVRPLNYRTGAGVAGRTTGRGAAENEAKSSCSFCRAGKHGVALRTTQTRRRS
jgi:hypothetical protein